jgi:RNA polymerase sigma-70 factor (ECF subfamily)
VRDVAPGPDERVEDDETLSIAFLTLLERLSPVERAVYVLHELFGFAHDEVAGVVEKSPANCRQILARARRHVDAGRPRFDPSRSEREALLQRFLRAARAGDVGALVELLAADAVAYGDAGGKTRAPLLPILGAEKVARLWASIAQPERSGPVELRPADVNGQPGVVGTDPGGRVVGVLTLAVADGRVQSVWAVVNPDKLARVPTAAPDQ